MQELEKVLDGLGWKYRKTGKGYLLNCPFAAKTHKSGVDNHPSFVLWPGISFGKCYSCGVCGDFETLFGQVPGLEVKDFALLGLEALLKDTVDEDLQILDGDILRFFSDALESTEVQNFIQARGFDSGCIIDYSLRFDARKNALIFPTINTHGALVGAVGRSVVEKRHYNYFRFPTGKTLGGAQRLSNNKKLAIVEGFTDILNCYQWANELGFDVVCTWTANMTRDQAILAADTGKRIHCWYDQDEAGHRGFKSIQRLLEDSDYGLTRALWPDSRLDVGAMDRDTFFSIFSR